MNLILFESHEIAAPLPRTDRRAVHILDVLRRATGETFDVGIINGARGKAALVGQTADAITLSFAWNDAATIDDDAKRFAPPITLIVGLPRPQTARDILRDATTLGVAALHFVRTEKAERSYAQSSLWSSGEWRRHAIAGAEQAFDTHVPEITHDRSLAEITAALPADSVRLALDNYESPARLGEFLLEPDCAVALAIGAERGWSASERDLLRAQRFTCVHLGARVLRTEAAVIAALAIVRSKLGLM